MVPEQLKHPIMLRATYRIAQLCVILATKLEEISVTETGVSKEHSMFMKNRECVSLDLNPVEH